MLGGMGGSVGTSVGGFYGAASGNAGRRGRGEDNQEKILKEDEDGGSGSSFGRRYSSESHSCGSVVEFSFGTGTGSGTGTGTGTESSGSMFVA
jgi:hypothetical protein